ncbi:hypothetical protein [Actinomycetospora cinnamomea]|uniref:Uncharacterized protein n=1 Tax=Actinomycetospora cinnamomea TaxID=663609 RepID=A0A2U1EWC2_9PSEU|nr:hypothetical protein [Actinomycetospora cinnamomea]PVZ04227.1 hypothetical protein C8D89_11814 [Actinomycetospora cinnamomea]
MSRRRNIDWVAVQQAALHDQIRHADLLELGVLSSTIARKVQAKVWGRSAFGVISLSGPPRTRDQELAAAVLYGGPGAVLSGAAAARLHGLERLPQEAEGTALVLVEHGRHRVSRGPITVERTHRVPEAQLVRDLPVAPLPRAVVDAARRLGDTDAIRALLAEAVQRRLTTPRELRSELEEGCGRGTARVRPVLTEIEDGVRSVPEAWARTLAASIPDLPPMMWNRRIVTADRAWLADPDGWLDDVGLAWEIHSFRHHADPEAFDATMRRQARMTGHDVHVVAHTPRQLRDDRAQVARISSPLTRRRLAGRAPPSACSGPRDAPSEGSEGVPRCFPRTQGVPRSSGAPPRARSRGVPCCLPRSQGVPRCSTAHPAPRTRHRAAHPRTHDDPSRRCREGSSVGCQLTRGSN